MLQKGDLVKIIEAPDQNKYVMQPFLGKLGIVIERVESHSSPNIWKLWVDGRIEPFHALDFIKVEQ